MKRPTRAHAQMQIGRWVATLDIGWMGWKPELTWLRWAPWYGLHWLFGGLSFVRLHKPSYGAGVAFDLGERTYNVHVRTLVMERL